jgi:hypothetical protein
MEKLDRFCSYIILKVIKTPLINRKTVLNGVIINMTSNVEMQ